MTKLTKNQFAVLLAVAGGNTTTAAIAKAAGIVWHSANVAAKALVAKKLLGGETGTFRVYNLRCLTSVVFVQKGHEVAEVA